MGGWVHMEHRWLGKEVSVGLCRQGGWASGRMTG